MRADFQAVPNCSLNEKKTNRMHLTHQLELFPDHRVTQVLFKDVKNAAELRQNAVAGRISAALVKPTMVRFLILFTYF